MSTKTNRKLERKIDFTICVTKAQRARIKELAAAEGMSASLYIVRAVEAYHRTGGTGCGEAGSIVTYGSMNEVSMAIRRTNERIDKAEAAFSDLYDTFCRGGYDMLAKLMQPILDALEEVRDECRKARKILLDMSSKVLLMEYHVPLVTLDFEPTYAPESD